MLAFMRGSRRVRLSILYAKLSDRKSFGFSSDVIVVSLVTVCKSAIEIHWCVYLEKLYILRLKKSYDLCKKSRAIFVRKYIESAGREWNKRIIHNIEDQSIGTIIATQLVRDYLLFFPNEINYPATPKNEISPRLFVQRKKKRLGLFR